MIINIIFASIVSISSLIMALVIFLRKADRKDIINLQKQVNNLSLRIEELYEIMDK